MRWRNSVALPSAPQLMFEAICSAADAMDVSSHEKRRLRFPGRRRLGKLEFVM
jgi:hypothetical protein